MTWLAKAVLQGGISILPGSNRVNLFIKRRLGYVPDLAAYVSQKRHQATVHLKYLQSVDSRKPSEIAIGEIGTGTYPVIPILMWLAGFEKIVSVDIEPITDCQAVRELINFTKTPEFTAAINGFPISTERLKELHDSTSESTNYLDDLRTLGIDLVIADLADDAKSLDECDFIISNNVFEHISRAVLTAILKKIASGSDRHRLSSHEIDLSDHYSHFDPSISPYNFLKFSDRVWTIFNNRLHYQNRLRASDYRKLFEANDWTIEIENAKRHSEHVSSSIEIGKSFAMYDKDDIAVTNLWIGARC